ncbi:DNA mismatch repair protein MutS [Bacteroides faecis]|uniref:DNA mismatch repair protein MutS n=1 Tax=Bacteroides faecis TaxID=674529 RepID=A0AAW5NYW4_9BACE|nr:DNA mismatch repair protein MutS [Bacteroides faecis]MCS2793826.1 DNA mismatch repair protein MutS [Bacteroides faecis]
MAKQTNKEKDIGLMKQFDELKRKHPDALLLFRQGNFYELYKEDAVKATVILAIDITDKLLPGEKEKVPTLRFPQSELDTRLPKLIRAGSRVAICDPLDNPLRKKAGNKEQQPISNNEDMAKKKKEKVVQEEPVKAVKNAAEDKPAKKKKTETQAEATVETKNGQTSEATPERKPREPQMVTANGEKVTHGHAYQNKEKPEDWYFTAKMDGKQLKPQKMDAADLAAYQNKEMTVPQLMERYYPTKLQPKVPEEAFKMPKSMAGPEGTLTVEKFNVYKEKDEQRPDFGKYKFYAQVGDAKMSVVASRQDLNAYFDRVTTPEKLVEKNFGEKLHLKSAYEKYSLPEGVDAKGVRVAKDRTDNKWKVSVDMGDKGKTSKQEISFDDGYSLFKTKTATREQIAAKYLTTEIVGMLAARSVKVEKTASIKR